MRSRTFSTTLIALAILVGGIPATASAENARAHTGDLSSQLEALPTGDQLLIEGRSGAIQFAGHSVQLNDFTGVAGFGSEIAYLVAIDGSARLGGYSAERGKMLLVPPFGAEPDVQRFDAGRLLDALETETAFAGVPAIAQLASLADSQGRGVFFGRLGRTSFNVATLGSAGAEMARRERVGGTAIRDVRFSTNDAGQDIEQDIVTRFLAALAAGDADTVAELLDPLPYGYGTMANGGGDARRLMARNLIAQRDWRAFAASIPTRTGPTGWVASGAGSEVRIALRRTTEFAFIQSIEVGG